MSPVGYPKDTILVGPCPCRACGARLWWTGWRWVEASGKRHHCGPRP